MDTSRIRSKLQAAAKKAALLPPLPSGPGKVRLAPLSPPAAVLAPDQQPPLLPAAKHAAKPAEQPAQDQQVSDLPGTVNSVRTWTRPALSRRVATVARTVRTLTVTADTVASRKPDRSLALSRRWQAISQQPVHKCSECPCSAAVCHCCHSGLYRRNIAQYGTGIYLYFWIVGALSTLLAVMCLLAAPSVFTHIWLNRQPKEACPTSVMFCVLFSTLGNVPVTDPAVQTSWLYGDVFGTSEWVYFFHSASDAAYSLAIVVGIVWIRLQKEAKMQEQDQLATTAADFTLEVSAFECFFTRNIDSHSDENIKQGLEDLMAKLVEHFERVATQTMAEAPQSDTNGSSSAAHKSAAKQPPKVVEVTLGLPQRELLLCYTQRARLLQAIEDMKSVQAAVRNEKKLESLQNEINSIQTTIQSEQDKIVQSARVPYAFVTFNEAVHMDHVIEIYKQHQYNVWCCHQPSLYFKGRRLSVKRAPEPSNVRWENLGYGWLSHLLRRLFTALFTGLMLLVSIILLYFSYKAKGADLTESCDVAVCAESLQTQFEAAASSSGSGSSLLETVDCSDDSTTVTFRALAVTECKDVRDYCWEDLTYSDLLGGSDAICDGTISAKIQQTLLILLPSLVVVVVNTILRQGLKLLVPIERHSNYSNFQTGLLAKLFWAQFLNTTLIVFVVTSETAHEPITALCSAFRIDDMVVSLLGIPESKRVMFFEQTVTEEMEEQWYSEVGVTFCTTMLLNAILPKVTILLYELIAQTRRCCCTGCAKTQSAMDRLYAPSDMYVSEKYASMLNTIFSTLFLCSGMPLLLFIALLDLFLLETLDRYGLFNIYERPVQFDEKPLEFVIDMLPLALFMHLCLACWTFSANFVRSAEYAIGGVTDIDTDAVIMALLNTTHYTNGTAIRPPGSFERNTTAASIRTPGAVTASSAKVNALVSATVTSIWDRLIGKTTVAPVLVLCCLVSLFALLYLTVYQVLRHGTKGVQLLVKLRAAFHRGHQIAPGSVSGDSDNVLSPARTYIDSLEQIKAGGMATYAMTSHPEYVHAFDDEIVHGFQTWRCTELAELVANEAKRDRIGNGHGSLDDPAAASFELFDRNNDRVIGFEEFAAGMRSSGKSADEISTTFKAMDIDCSGFLSIAEFRSGFVHLFLADASSAAAEAQPGCVIRVVEAGDPVELHLFAEFDILAGQTMVATTKLPTLRTQEEANDRYEVTTQSKVPTEFGHAPAEVNSEAAEGRSEHGFRCENIYVPFGSLVLGSKRVLTFRPMQLSFVPEGSEASDTYAQPELSEAELAQWLSADSRFYNSCKSEEFGAWLAEHQLNTHPKETEEQLLALAQAAMKVVATEIRYTAEHKHRLCGWSGPAGGVKAGQTDDAGHAIIFVSILRALGVPARAVAGHWAGGGEEGSPPGKSAALVPHVAAEFHCGKSGWIWVETCSKCPRGGGVGRYPIIPFVARHFDFDLSLQSEHVVSMPELGRREAVGRAQDFVLAACAKHYQTAFALAGPEVFDTEGDLAEAFESIRPLDLGLARRTLRGTAVENGLTMFCECELAADWRATVWVKPSPSVTGSVVGYFSTSKTSEPPVEPPTAMNPAGRLGPWAVLQNDLVWRIGRPSWENGTEASRSWVIDPAAVAAAGRVEAVAGHSTDATLSVLQDEAHLPLADGSDLPAPPLPPEAELPAELEPAAG